MLIDANIADAPTQRFYALSLFVFLQALKFYDLLQLYTPGSQSPSETLFVVKWIAIDAAYLLLVPKLRIPWLAFRLSTIFVQVLLISGLNICLSARISISPTAVLGALFKLLFDRETAVLEHNIKLSSIIHNASRILGQHTINILPESTAKLNPQSACFCVQDGPVTIPLRLNSTVPMLVQYSRVSPADNSVEQFNLTGKPLKQLLRKVDHSRTSIWELPITVTEPGLYRIDRVRDESRLDVRLYRSKALVVRCPSASLVIPDRLRERTDRCTGELDELTLQVVGLPPLKVKYNRYIEGAERVSTIDSVKPLDYTSPLMVSRQEVGVEINKVEDISWAKEKSVDVQLNSTLNTAGQWSYTIEEVEDACGNVISYGGRPGDETRAIEAPSYAFEVHRRPTIAFVGCDPEHPTKLVEHQKAALRFAIGTDEPGPFDVEIRKDGEYFARKVMQRGGVVSVNQEGTYDIAKFASPHCTGEVLMPSTCVVYTPPRPSLTVAFEPIQDQCAGSIGLLADLTMAGNAPFEITWRETKSGRGILHRKKIDRSRHQLRFLPEEAGHFVYEFVSLDDAVYKGIDVSGTRKDISVYPLAGAAFVDRVSRRSCLGDAVKLPVKLVGTGPWQLEYELMHEGKRERVKKTDLKDNVYEIQTPAFTSGGQYTVTLVSVQDVNGCKTPLEEKDAHIEVRRDRPQASIAPINGEMDVTIIDGSSLSIPLRLVGDGPWRLTYDGPEGEKTISVQDANGALSVNTPGVYKLKSVRDAFCPGVVTSDTFTINVFPRPSLSLEAGQMTTRPAVCEGDEDAFNIHISGAPPFMIKYDRTRLNDRGLADKKTVELNAALPVVGIKALTSPPGTYRYTFDGVADARYDASHDSPLVVEQFVRSRPQATFVSHGKTYSYCLEVDLADQVSDKIPMKLQGEAPFKLEFSIKHELSGITEHFVEEDISANDWALKVPSNLLSLGRHAIRALEVSDKHGCSRSLSEKQSGAIFIEISERPTILPSSTRTDLCVGDRITYALQGKPPFTVEYEFQNSRKKATVTGPVFSRVAEKPGQFRLLTLGDSASRCKVSIDGQEKTIYDIPSVRVSDGKTIVESIHEGDQAEIIFHLFGEPPFALTYTRSERDARGRMKVMETHSVSGITEDTYRVFSSVSGTYAATQVYDAHCRMV